MQTTIKKIIKMSGVGLHSGIASSITILPASAEYGIWFRRIDIMDSDNLIPARYDAVSNTKLCTRISNSDGAEVSTIEHLMRVNIQAPILLSKYLVRSMLLNQKGRIINISSIIAQTGFNGLSVYAASKAALEGFSHSLAREVGKAGITVNCVAPGYMQTDMTSSLQGDKLESVKRRSPLGKLATVDDAASMVMYLLSEQASAITGTVITVDAGSTA